MFAKPLAALAAFASFASLTSAQSKGFNYGATDENGACRDYADFSNYFQVAKNLVGTSGFTSARLYTTIQCGTTNSPTSAIQAAIDTDTTLVLGLWSSAGGEVFGYELDALASAIAMYGTAFTDRVVGISVGSEDLYRSSPQGVANEAGVGATADVIVDYIARVRDIIAGTSLADAPVGHVDTWTAWVLGENAPVASAVDFLGHNSFPYFESTRPNSIEDSLDLFYSALGATEGVANGKPVWVTETGWPYTGPASNLAVASVGNAEHYWKETGCSLFGTRNVWWYTLTDANTAQTDISFGVAGNPPTVNPVYDLTC